MSLSGLFPKISEHFFSISAFHLSKALIDRMFSSTYSTLENPVIAVETSYYAIDHAKAS
jgi:hypothetical protein